MLLPQELNFSKSTYVKMAGDFPRLILMLLMMSSLASSYCPSNKVHNFGDCNFRVVCVNHIKGVGLPNKCRGSVNHPVQVEVTLDNAVDQSDDQIDTEFLSTITKFQAIAYWPNTSLSLVTYMPKLKTLILSNNHIQTIDGTPFFNLKYLKYVDLSRNSLVDIEDLFTFDPMDQPNILKTLLLSNNAIENIYGDTFSELANLKVLDLSYNLISDLTEEPFLNLTNLEILRLNNNRIKDLNGAVNSLVNLKHLYLRGNQIQNIDEPSLKIIHHLETFDVSGNQLEKLKPIIFTRHWHHFGGTCRIILAENQITSIPNGTSMELTSRFVRELGTNKIDVFTEVDLSKNEINSIEYNAFQSIVQMINLDLSSNNLTSFIVNPVHLRDVKYLNLSCNSLTNLYYHSFSTMTHLQNLDLSHNRLRYIPHTTFINNYNLKFVNITFNEINVLKNLHIRMFHPTGGQLDLSNNGLSMLNVPSKEALRLTDLVLNSNDIADAASINLNHQNELKRLQMRNNLICRLNDTSLRLPVRLIYLDLTANAIEDIGPSSFRCVSHLKYLYLGHNKLKNIQYGAFRDLTSLSNLDLSYNSIKHLDSKVLMDLKSLSALSLTYNGLYFLDYKGWLGHKYDLKVYLDGNDITCEWLGEALKDFNYGFSKMRPTVQQFITVPSKNSLEGIPCIPGSSRSENIIDLNTREVLADERLLVINQKILEAVKEQTYYLRSFMNQFNNANNTRSVLTHKIGIK